MDSEFLVPVGDILAYLISLCFHYCSSMWVGIYLACYHEVDGTSDINSMRIKTLEATIQADHICDSGNGPTQFALENRWHVPTYNSIRPITVPATKDLLETSPASGLSKSWLITFECSVSLVTQALHGLKRLKLFDDSNPAWNVLAHAESMVWHTDFNILAQSSQMLTSALKSPRTSGMRGLLWSTRLADVE
jgi:hypothetical protein